MLYIEPGSPWEKGCCESFNGKLRDECLNQEIFYSLKEAKIVTEQWRNHFNTIRPHSSLGYRPPAPRHPQPKCCGWIRRPPCSNLYPAGSKYPSGQTHLAYVRSGRQRRYPTVDDKGTGHRDECAQHAPAYERPKSAKC
jgi:hypothetical protein